jgi:hypothetical protein
MKNIQMGGDNHSMLHGYSKKAKQKTMSVENRANKKHEKLLDFVKNLKYFDILRYPRPNAYKKGTQELSENAKKESKKISERLGL